MLNPYLFLDNHPVQCGSHFYQDCFFFHGTQIQCSISSLELQIHFTSCLFKHPSCLDQLTLLLFLQAPLLQSETLITDLFRLSFHLHLSNSWSLKSMVISVLIHNIFITYQIEFKIASPLHESVSVWWRNLSDITSRNIWAPPLLLAILLQSVSGKLKSPIMTQFLVVIFSNKSKEIFNP